MSQEADGSLLISLIWAAYIYWLACQLSADHSSAKRQGESRPGNGPRKAATGENANPAATDAMASEGLRAIVSDILRFERSSLDDFLAKAASAYQTIVAAFNAGDCAALRTLVSAEVYDVFLKAIAARQGAGAGAGKSFSLVGAPQIVDASIDWSQLSISIRYTAESLPPADAATGRTTADEPTVLRTVDVWTFRRSAFAGNTSWQLVATAGED
jgi:predicted lipid-binding transport protein (Tim44 family)